MHAMQSQPSQSPPFGLLVLLVIACILYQLMLVLGLGDSVWQHYKEYHYNYNNDAEARGLFEFALFVTNAVLVGLWFVLALMLVGGGMGGEMPLWAAALAVFLVPLSGVGAYSAFTHGFDQFPKVLVPALLPPLIAFYAFWARLPRLHVVLPAQPTSIVTWTLIFTLSVVPFVVQSFYLDRAAPGELKWIDAGYFGIPHGAVEGGKEAAPASTISYICRISVNGEIYPGEVTGTFGSCNRADLFWEFKTEWPQYQILVGDGVSWVAARGGAIPEKAYEAGQDYGDKFYVCRASYEGGIHVGNLSHGSEGCNIPFNGRVYHITDYEILVKE
jgi:hypothetical protein